VGKYPFINPFLNVDQETSIMHKLQNLVLEQSHVLTDVMELCAELDW